MEEIYIAVGKNTRKSRNSANWANVKMLWPALAVRLSQTTYTLETYKEYIKLGDTKEGKEEQANIKDRGCFVGGYLKDGKRHPANVQFRQLLTLDLDFASLDFWETFTFYFDVEALIHSTHKHSAETPRYRLVVPLNRRVSREEYEAIARKLAGDLNINHFDPTTFQPERLMYWPTTAKDGEFVFEHQKGKFLNADEVLATYFNWKDVSSWPRPVSENEVIKNGIKQGKPADKPGLIGAFCRSFGVTEALNEFVPGVYEETAVDDRLTYKNGSTAAGAIIYGNDEFIYSNHSTDPGCNKLFNAFDAVRVHKFGHEDEGKEDYPVIKKPSYRLMCDLARGIPSVVKQLAFLSLPIEDFTDENIDNSWLERLTVDKNGQFETTIDNFHLICANDGGLINRLRYDEFNHRDAAFRPLPWDVMKFVTEDGQDYVKQNVTEFTDRDDAGLRQYIEKKYKIYHIAKSTDALGRVFDANRFNPVRDYLDTVKWDGTPRLESMLIDYLGASDNVFTRAATRKAFVACVSRIYNPGCKFDYVLTLIGPQGIGKSTILAKMGGTWFSDSFLGVDGNKAFEQLQGSWLIEIAELAGFKKGEIEAIKHFITKTSDKFRVAYGKRNSEFPRQCVLFGTSNEDKPLRDYTGNRRFWPVEVTGFGKKHISDIPVNQLWAEAKQYFTEGEKLYFDAVAEEAATEAQSKHTEFDDREPLIAEYLEMALPESWDKYNPLERRGYILSYNDANTLIEKGEVQRLSICVAEIWCELFKSDLKDMGPHNTKYLHQIMSNMPGWEKSKWNITFPIYGKQRAYTRKGANVTHYNKKTVKK